MDADPVTDLGRRTEQAMTMAVRLLELWVMHRQFLASLRHDQRLRLMRERLRADAAADTARARTALHGVRAGGTDWARNATSAQLAQAWKWAAVARDDDELARIVEAELAHRAPESMALYEEARQQGRSRIEAMREAAPLLDAELGGVRIARAGPDAAKWSRGSGVPGHRPPPGTRNRRPRPGDVRRNVGRSVGRDVSSRTTR